MVSRKFVATLLKITSTDGKTVRIDVVGVYESHDNARSALAKIALMHWPHDTDAPKNKDKIIEWFQNHCISKKDFSYHVFSAPFHPQMHVITGETKDGDLIWFENNLPYDNVSDLKDALLRHAHGDHYVAYENNVYATDSAINAIKQAATLETVNK